MADEISPIERQNQLAIGVVDQSPTTVEPRFYEGTLFGLPREWTAEIRPRKVSSKYSGKVDQFFYEPGTRRQFHSLEAAKRHLGLEVGQTSGQRKSKASKSPDQSENLNEKGKFESQTAGQSENVDEVDMVGSSTKIGKENKDKDNYLNFDKIARRVKWHLIDGEKNSWDLYVKVPDVVQERWMDMFLKPDNFNQKNNPSGMK